MTAFRDWIGSDDGASPISAARVGDTALHARLERIQATGEPARVLEREVLPHMGE